MLTSPKTSPILSPMDTPTTYAPSDSPLSSPVSSSTLPPSDGMRGVPPSPPVPTHASPLKPLEHSSWISEVLYLACPDGRSYMAIFKHTTPGDTPEAMFYGPNVPFWLPGLLQAGVTKDGKHSVGKAYNKHVKGKYQYTCVKGSKEVAELRRMFIVGS